MINLFSFSGRITFILTIALVSFLGRTAMAQHGPGPHHHKKKKPKTERTEAVVETISVYPNPVTKYVEIETEVTEEEEMTGCNGGTSTRESQDAQYVISDLEGIVYLEKTVSAEEDGPVRFDLGELKNGVYIIKKITGDIISYARLTVEH